MTEMQIAQDRAENKYNGKPSQSLMIDKLRDIKPGETVLYYRGDFDREVQDRESDTPGVRRYRGILRELRDYALALRDEGRIGIDAPIVKGTGRKGNYWYREYMAIGL